MHFETKDLVMAESRKIRCAAGGYRKLVYETASAQPIRLNRNQTITCDERQACNEIASLPQ
jgi:hypothetical protein